MIQLIWDKKNKKTKVAYTMINVLDKIAIDNYEDSYYTYGSYGISIYSKGELVSILPTQQTIIYITNG